MNQLFQELSGQQNNQPQQQNNNGNILSRLYQFSQNFKGDPEQQVKQLMQSGKISQDQYQNAVNQANAIYSMLHK